jgi:zinc protease
MKAALKIHLSGILLIGMAAWFMSCFRENPKELTSEVLPVQNYPMVSFRILLKVGSAHDPAGKEGLARLVGSMLAGGGSATMTAGEIAARFFPMAAGVSLIADKEMTIFSGTVHLDNLERYYALLKDMLLNPGFRQEDFDRLKADQLDFLDKTLVSDDDETLGKEILNLVLYEGHPYGHHEAGTVASVGRLTLEDVKAFYKEHFVQGNVLIGLGGGYPENFLARVLADFKKLPEGFTPALNLPQPRPPRGYEFVVAEKRTPATAISMGFPISITKADKDFFALWIACAHFGEHRQPLSLLFQKIREERGLNCGDYAYLEHFVQGRDAFPAPNHSRQQQYFSIWIRPVANANRLFVIRQTLHELKKLVDEGLSEERFELIRTYLLNYTRLYAQTLSEHLGWQMESAYYGYLDFLNEVPFALGELTREDVNLAVKKYLNDRSVRIAVVTEDGEGFKRELLTGAPSPIRYAGPPMSKAVLEEDRAIQAYPLDVKPDNVRVAPASEFFRKAGLPGRPRGN